MRDGLRFFCQAALAGVVTMAGGIAVMAVLLARFERRRFEALQRAWARSLARIGGVRLEGGGMERFTAAPPCVVVSNHRSHFDLVAILSLLPSPPLAVAKRSLFYIPILGWAMALAGHIPLDRKNPRRARTSLQKAQAMLKRGQSVLFFPEGTRNPRPEEGLLPFHMGAFRLAKEAGVPVLPIAVEGGEKAFPPHARAIRSGKVTLRIGEIIASDALSAAELAQRTRAAIEGLLHETAEKNRILTPLPTGL